MFHFDTVLQVPVFPDLAVLFLDIFFYFYQVMIDQINGRQRIQHICGMLVDPSHTGHQAECRHRECRQLWNIVEHVRLPEQKFDYDPHQKSRYRHGLHSILWQNRYRSCYAEPSGKFHIVFAIFLRKECFSLQYLDLLDPAQGLVHPLIDLPLIPLVVLSQLPAVSFGKNQKRSHTSHQQPQHDNGNGFAHKQQIDSKHKAYCQLRHQLHGIQDYLHKF